MQTSITDFIEASNAAKTADELVKAYSKALAHFGYDRFMYAMMTEDPLNQWHKVPSIARNYPEHWMAFYIEHGYMAIDPLRHIAFRARRPVIWDTVPKVMELSPIQEQCLNQGIESGLFNGIGIPFHGPFGEVAGIGLATSEKTVDLNPSIVSALALLSNQFHTVHTGLVLDDLALPPIHLTQREKEILLWCAWGKNNSEIAEILNISHHGVKFHVDNCIGKLGAESRINAVLKAIRLGLIMP